MMSEPNPFDPGDAAPRRRRPRYPGTHPRRFEQRYKELNPEAHPGIHAHVRAQGRTPAGAHVPVLLGEVLAALSPGPGNWVADCTLGYGGHAVALLQRIAPGGRLVAFDVDTATSRAAEARLAAAAAELPGIAYRVVHSNFAGIGKALRAEGRLFDVILADLGPSSMQFDDPARGFSYKHDGPLDMRMDPRRRSAAEILAEISETDWAAALRDLADEPYAEQIARAVVQRRREQPITRTLDLANLVAAAVEPMDSGLDRPADEPRRPRRLARDSAATRRRHPAMRTFQALRILVNDELGCLAQLLRDAPYCLQPAGRIGVISFHSGEDRMVKHAFRDGRRNGQYAAISDGPIRPSPQERHDNPRSASAKLRWARTP